MRLENAMKVWLSMI